MTPASDDIREPWSSVRSPTQTSFTGVDNTRLRPLAGVV
jgi:hypothetical protein